MVLFNFCCVAHCNCRVTIEPSIQTSMPTKNRWFHSRLCFRLCSARTTSEQMITSRRLRTLCYCPFRTFSIESWFIGFTSNFDVSVLITSPVVMPVACWVLVSSIAVGFSVSAFEFSLLLQLAKVTKAKSAINFFITMILDSTSILLPRY
ncbi:MAG: hypothetical protein JWQ96_2883 [Segetibacter sp.]|nr:hypothetical protein [Segetibacter sp.]